LELLILKFLENKFEKYLEKKWKNGLFKNKSRRPPSFLPGT
jgi:hypothetical protein